jgi:hypothetical protein
LVTRATLATCWLASFAPLGIAQTVNDQIAKAWQERNDKVRTFEFHFTSTSTYYKGGLSIGAEVPTPRPDKDTQATCLHKYLLGGTTVRIELDGLQWSGEDFRQIRRTTILDGKRKTYIEEGATPAPRGWIGNDSDYLEVKGQDFRPLTRHFRGASKSMRSFLIDELKPTGAKLVIGGRSCEQFVIKRVGGDRSEFWLDPGRDWIVVREVYVHPGRNYTQLDIVYGPHQICGWIPTSWEFRQTVRDTRPVSTERYVVTKYALNEPIADSVFTLTFPAETNVLDVRDKNDPKQYVSKGDAVQTLAAEPEGRWSWWHYAVGALAAGLIATCVSLACRKRTQSGPGSESR